MIVPHLAKGLDNYVNNDLNQVGPSAIRAFDQKISHIPGLIRLTVGEPDFDVPEHVKKAATASIIQNDSHYSASKGKLKLRQAISHYLNVRQGLNYDPETEIVVTVGATEALKASLAAILNPGDQVIIPTPAFALYFPLVETTGAKAVMLNTADDGFILTPERLEQALINGGERVKAVILNYPCNPTGIEYTEKQIRALAEVLRQHQVFVIADEIYSELTYGVDHFSIARVLPEQTVLINGLSKSHAMTGYRIGYIAGPAAYIKNAAKIHGFMVTTTSNPAQAAATEALTNGLADPLRMKVVYQRRRDFIEQAITEMGLKMAQPQGAFYAFVKISADYGTDDVQFAEDLAKQAKVGGVPGSAFGAGGAGYIRFSYATSDEKLQLAMTRIKRFLNEKRDQ